MLSKLSELKKIYTNIKKRIPDNNSLFKNFRNSFWIAAFMFCTSVSIIALPLYSMWWFVVSLLEFLTSFSLSSLGAVVLSGFMNTLVIGLILSVKTRKNDGNEDSSEGV